MICPNIKMNKNGKLISAIGIVVALIGAVLLAFTGYFVTLIQNSVPSSLILCYRFLIGLVIILPFIVLSKSFTFKMANVKLTFMRIFASFLSMLLFLYTLSYLPLANSVLLMNTAPLFIPVLLYFLVGLRTNKIVIMFLGVSFAGFLIIVNPKPGSFEVLGYILGLLSGFFSAVAALIIRRLGTNNNSPMQTIFYYFLFSSILSFIIGISHIKKLTAYEVEILLLIGLLGLVYQLALTYSLKTVQSRIVIPIMLSSVVFAGLIDWYFKGIVITPIFLIGTVIMIFGILGVIKFNN